MSYLYLALGNPCAESHTAHLKRAPRGAAAPAIEAPPAVAVLGVPLALTDYERTLDWIDATVAAARRGYVCVAAVHTVMACQRGRRAARRRARLDLTVPDGQPLVWALNALGHELARPRLRPRPDGALLRARRRAPARACTSTAGATRARSSSSR